MTPQHDERRAERVIALSFLITAAAAVGLAVVYLSGGQPQLEGALLAVAFGGLAYGFVTWGQKLMPQGPVVEERHRLTSTEEESEELESDLERGGVISRRKLLVRSLAVAGGALGVAALFPIRSLGPKPGKALVSTPWRDGLRLITDDGKPVLAVDVPMDGLVTVFPEGFPGSADGQAVLVRVSPELLHPAPGREDWSPDGFIVYSKVCTHAGCPVGLYQADSHTLLCPCHQSAFDVLDRARPTFGPAAVALPQLPIRLDGDGYIRARGDFSDPVGPAFWSRS
ncbi:MAG: ubiquinol-cytochrome c reductase iron-sulfur subunit [Actinobacteria bacterium]|nr:ubiquinol-cytochrome c reductase iron-sulfur subunit [Actinomycetota bacterium]MBV8959264.1 ubiquinol-cytochrome c reductase iron-sulfur subunit [Actinomycetota bacterium]MBV9663332.1 ubiquinol-cytochrome c reductase iron-sulfur subunit [Actinomycetota bacterium]MBV9935017.1 ubiquinol-cytochrome c reductase iron-sulfur subunit [Actinomycetota bacterium]